MIRSQKLKKKYLLIYLLLLPLLFSGCDKTNKKQQITAKPTFTSVKVASSASKLVTLPSGLQYKVIKKGNGKKPKATDKVTVNYRGSFENGDVFDSSYKRGQPATFPVNGVIKGWTQALQMMREGDEWQLIIPPSLGYGAMGSPPVIPPNSTLYFNVELLKVESN